MYFYSNGMNDYTITYGNNTYEKKKEKTYSVEHITLHNNTHTTWPPQEQLPQEYQGQWVDDEGEYVEGYREWAKSMEDKGLSKLAEVLDAYRESLPKKGEQLEFDFLRQNGI
jgi:hypothetical protein